jgi:hypothetical protein
VRSRFSFAGSCGLRAQLFGELVGVHGVLVHLFAEFVSGEMISLTVSRGGRGVGVGRKVMEFCGSIVCALWHGVSPAILDAVMSECSLSDPLSMASDHPLSTEQRDEDDPSAKRHSSWCPAH